MKEQLRHLEELQRFDARLQEQEATAKVLPEKLAGLKSDLARMEGLLERERQQLADSEKLRRELELQVKVDEANIAKAKGKLSGVRGGKEYMAAQREIESTRKIMSEREEEVLKLIDAIENARKLVVAHEADVAKLREHVEKEDAAIQAKVAEIEAGLADERSARAEIAARVRPDVLKRYGSIRMRRGLAVVPVVNGTCRGCHMTIPPQLFNTLQRGNSIETCPSCHRIIYWDELMKEAELERGEQGAPDEG